MTARDALKNLGKGLVGLDRVLFWWRASEPRTVPLWKVKALLEEHMVEGFEGCDVMAFADAVMALVDEEERR